ncbi:MAG: hypothetical protein QF752_06400 [Planctomycetota bacterium]|jgi:Flp pilus assembly pilin Flp|nr:hypothetical protein [Planctomycetota bacterium]
MAEYVILLLLIGLAILPLVQLFSKNVETKYGNSGEAIAHLSSHRRGALERHAEENARSLRSDDSEAEEEENPYVWDSDAQRWFDPASGYYVSFRAASRYVEDPYAYYLAAFEPGRLR